MSVSIEFIVGIFSKKDVWEKVTISLLVQAVSDVDTIFFKSEEINTLHYDNDLFGDDFHKLHGQVFGVLASIKISVDEGVTRIYIASLCRCRRDRKDRTLRNALSYLENNRHINNTGRKGFATFYFFKEKPFGKRKDLYLYQRHYRNFTLKCIAP